MAGLCHHQYWFIPTRVGKSQKVWSSCLFFPVHPHACGEVPVVTAQNINSRGSSPRVWGSLRVLLFQPIYQRFIPMRVGKSFHAELVKMWMAVHPHACGEVRNGGHIRHALHGSSPRVWGSRIASINEKMSKRFIPTRVGKSYSAIPRGWRNNGSSPRVWGSHIRPIPTGKIARFIPTRVGKSWPILMRRKRSTVHPHACGEVLLACHHGVVNCGSSPRVWGSRQLGVS